ALINMIHPKILNHERGKIPPCRVKLAPLRARGAKMSFVKRMAEISDIEELLGLYWSSYGEDYPLLLGTDKKAMKRAIEDRENFYWLIIRESESNTLAASCIIEIDRTDCIGKVTGVTVSKNYRRLGLATDIIREASAEI